MADATGRRAEDQSKSVLCMRAPVEKAKSARDQAERARARRWSSPAWNARPAPRGRFIRESRAEGEAAAARS